MMLDEATSTIAQILYTDYPVPGFAAIVSGMEQATASLQIRRRNLDWSEDDIVVFDTDKCRIILAIAEAPGGGHTACLSVAVGPPPDRDLGDGALLRAQQLCSALVEEIVADHPCDAVLWTEADGMITGDLVEALVDALPSSTEIRRLTDGRPAAPDAAPPAEGRRPAASPAERISIIHEAAMARAAAEPPGRAAGQAKASPATEAATDPVAAPASASQSAADMGEDMQTASQVANAEATVRLHDPELARLREALYPASSTVASILQPAGTAIADARPSTRMRLAVHTMNATLMVALLPVGAAMMVYTLLRGESFVLTARAVALSGFGLAVARQAPAGWLPL